MSRPARRHRPAARLRPQRAPRPLRVLLAGLALAAALALPAHAQEQPGGEGATPPPQSPAAARIEIVPPDGGQSRIVAWSDLAGFLRDGGYTLPDGTVADLDVVALADVLRKLNLDGSSYSSFVLTREDGTTTEITRVQMNPPFDPPVLYLDGTGTLALLRPKTADGPAERAVAVDGVLRLEMRAEPRLFAVPESVGVGQQVRFTVTPPDGVDANAVEYLWDFNDGGDVVRDSSATMTHAYADAGRYYPIVNFLLDGKRNGGEDFLGPSTEVVVHAKRRASRERGARNANDRRRGRDERDEGDGGAGGGDGGGTGGGAGGGGGGGAGGSGYDAGYDDDWPTANPAPAAAPPPPPDPAPRRKPAPRPEPRARAPPQPAGETVDGYLLAAADAPLPTGGAVTALDRAPDRADDRDGPLRIPTAAWIAVGLAGLILLGWTLESRTTLPYFKP